MSITSGGLAGCPGNLEERQGIAGRARLFHLGLNHTEVGSKSVAISRVNFAILAYVTSW